MNACMERVGFSTSNKVKNQQGSEEQARGEGGAGKSFGNFRLHAKEI